MIQPEELVFFIEWVVEKDEWHFDRNAKLWKQKGWRSRPTIELFEYWKLKHY